MGAVPPDDGHLQLQAALRGLSHADDPCDRHGLLRRLPANDLHLCLGAHLLHGGQQVHGLQEVRLPLGVAADEHAGAGAEGKVQAVEVAVVGKLETEQSHEPIIAESVGLRLHEGKAPRSRGRRTTPPHDPDSHPS